MRCPIWRICSKSPPASAWRSTSSSLLRFVRYVGIRSSRSFETLTVRASWVMNPLYGRGFWLSGWRRSGFVSQGRSRARQVRMDCQRGVKGEARLERGTGAEQDFAKMHHGGEMPGLQLERAADVLQTLPVAPEEVVEGRALVPCLGE